MEIIEIILNDTIVHLRQTNMVCSKCLWVPPQEYWLLFFNLILETEFIALVFLETGNLI